VARDIFVLAGLGNVLHEDTFTTGMRTRRVAEIQAGKRVLERGCGFLWRTNRATVSAVLDEGQFEFQFLQKFALLFRHRSLLGIATH